MLIDPKRATDLRFLKSNSALGRLGNNFADSVFGSGWDHPIELRRYFLVGEEVVLPNVPR